MNRTGGGYGIAGCGLYGSAECGEGDLWSRDMMNNRADWHSRWGSNGIEHGSASPDPTAEPSRQGVAPTLWSKDMMIHGARSLMHRLRHRLRRSHDIEHGFAIPNPTAPEPAPTPAPVPATDRPSTQAGCTIYEVPYRLRKVKETAYEPNVISIGPYHHDKPHLKAMEVIKRKCFDLILEVTKLESSKFMKAMEAVQEQARKCYEGPIDHCDKFVEMMVYDGCFVVQLIRGIYHEDLCKLGRHNQIDIWYDLLLLENQLPFFVLFKLDCMIMRNDEGSLDEFASSALSLFEKGMQGSHVWSGNGSHTLPAKDIKHLLDLVHNCCRPSPQGITQHQKFKGAAQKSDRSWKFIRSATELEDAGINFLGHMLQEQDQAQGAKSMFDITFTKDSKRLKMLKIQHTKVLKIPTLRVDDNTERLLRNLMAYEQFTQMGEPTYVSDYVVLMDNLINTGKDVQLLRNSGIIDNWLGDDEVVAQMFNKLRDHVCSSADFYYSETFVKVNKHCKRKWSKYKALLNRDYFNSPWSICSFVAAFFLMLFTLLQTTYTVLSYYQQ